jgi:hypothetical protein
VLKFIGGFGVAAALYGVVLAMGVVKPSNNLGINLLISISSRSEQIDFAPKQFTPEQNAHPLRTYLQFARNEPGEFIKQRTAALRELWGVPAATSESRSTASRLLIAVRLPLLLIALVGFWLRRKQYEAWLLLGPIVAITVVHVAMFSSPRFTYVVEPFLIALAVVVLHECVARTRQGPAAVPSVASSPT